MWTRCTVFIWTLAKALIEWIALWFRCHDSRRPRQGLRFEPSERGSLFNRTAQTQTDSPWAAQHVLFPPLTRPINHEDQEMRIPQRYWKCAHCHRNVNTLYEAFVQEPMTCTSFVVRGCQNCVSLLIHMHEKCPSPLVN